MCEKRKKPLCAQNYASLKTRIPMDLESFKQLGKDRIIRKLLVELEINVKEVRA